MSSVSDDHRTPQRHVMFNPVTPDVSPPVRTALQTATPKQQHNYTPQNMSADTSAVTSVDIQEMDQVRQHLQHMMKTMHGFNIHSDDEHVPDGQVEEGGMDNSMSSVDTAAFLQKLLPNSSPLEELKVHFGDQSHRSESSSQATSTENRKARAQGYHGNSTSDRGTVAENSLLRDHLERERFRRKHCEQQIQELQGKLLELQQELAVTVSSERKKDVMIEQLDRTLAKVVEGWKRHENEKITVINTLKSERDVQEKAHQKQQEMLLQFEKELSQAVEALTKEQERASHAEKEKEAYIEQQKTEREQLLQVLSKEKDKHKETEEEKLEFIKEKEQAQMKFMEAQRAIQELTEKNRDLQRQFSSLEQEFADTLNEEKKNLEQERKISKDSHSLISSLQKEVQRLTMELDTTSREKESLKMEMSLMEARHEAGRAKDETERQAELERQMNERLEEIHQHMAKSDAEIRESHRKQLQEINNKHKEEMKSQLEKFHDELKKKDVKLKTASQEFEDRIYQAQDKIAKLTNHRQQLENERQNMTIRMQTMMQTHCEEALRLLGRNTNKSPGSSQVIPEFRSDGMSSVSTEKWPPHPQPQQPSSVYSTHGQNNPTKDYITSQNYTKSQPSSVASNSYQQNEPKSFTYNHTTITAPLTTGYPGGVGYPDYPGSYVGGYVGNNLDSSVLTGMPRATGDFVPLRSIQGDHDTDNVISGLRASPVPTTMVSGIRGSSPLPTTEHPSFGYHSAKVLSSGGSLGDTQRTLLEQDLEDTRVSLQPQSPDTLPPRSPPSPRHEHQDISAKLHEQEQRQSELNHYINMLLKRSPGQPIDEGGDHLESGLLAIPSSARPGPTEAISPIKPDTTGYPSRPYDATIGSDSVTKDQSQATRHGTHSTAMPAFTKATVPTTFSMRNTKLAHEAPPVSRTNYPRHQALPHTPPRRDRDPGNVGPDQLPPLTPHQMDKLSRLIGMVGGQAGVELPSAEQLAHMLRAVGAQPHSRQDTSTSHHKDTNRVKRNLDSSFPPSKGRQKPPAPSIDGHPIPATQPHPAQGSTLMKQTESSRNRQSSGGSASAPPRGVQEAARQSGTRQQVVKGVPQVKAERKPTGNQKQGKASNAWR